MTPRRVFPALCVLASCLWLAAAEAAGAEKRNLRLGDTLKAAVPGDWIVKTPRIRIIEYEYEVPADSQEVAPGRVTVMRAGGSIEQNIERWFGQFLQPDGSSTAKKADVDKLTVADRTVYVVDVSGTYRDQRGPFAPAVLRPKYRMLAAIIPTESGNYFIKFYGPEETVSGQAEAFRDMVEGIEKAE